MVLTCLCWPTELAVQILETYVKNIALNELDSKLFSVETCWIKIQSCGWYSIYNFMECI